MALPNDAQRAAEAIAKLEASNPEYDTDAAKKQAPRLMIRKHYQFKTANVAANAAIVGNVSEKIEMHANGRVLAATFNPDFTLDVSANASNYATMALKPVHSRFANGAAGNGATGTATASATLRPTANGGTGNLSVGVGYPLTVDADNARYTRGQCLAPDIAQTNGGIAAVAGSWTVHVEEEDVDFVGAGLAGWGV